MVDPFVAFYLYRQLKYEPSPSTGEGRVGVNSIMTHGIITPITAFPHQGGRSSIGILLRNRNI